MNTLPEYSSIISTSKEYKTSEKSRLASRLWKKRNKERNDVYQKKWKRENKEKIWEYYKNNGRTRAKDYLETAKKWRKNNREKARAHGKLNYAVKTGRITKPTKCFYCLREKKLSGHHFDYKKALEVLWLCSSCHKIEHNFDILTRVL